MLNGLLVLVLLTGCASLSQPAVRATKQCSDSPRNAVARFLQGIIEFSFIPIRLVIPDGVSISGIFGGGDTGKGWQIVQQLYRHPEVLDRKSDVGIEHLEPVEMVDLGNGETRILLERKDVVTRRGPDGELEEIPKIFRQNFAVRFQPGTNCITAVRPIDPHWQRIK